MIRRAGALLGADRGRSAAIGGRSPPADYLRKRAYFLRAAAVSEMPPIATTFASNSSVRGNTLNRGTRTGLILPERFEIAVRVRFEVVDGMVKCFIQIVRWDDDCCKGILVFIENVLMRIPMCCVVSGLCNHILWLIPMTEVKKKSRHLSLFVF